MLRADELIPDLWWGQEAEPSCWWLQWWLLLGTEVGESHPKCRGVAQLQSLWQVVCLSNPALSCSKTSIRHSFCVWCTRNLTSSWLPQSSLAQGHETEAYSPSLLLPTAALAPHRALAKHHGCVAAAEGAASHQGDQFLLQVHRIPAPGKEALGEQAGVAVPQLPNPIPSVTLVHRRWPQTQEVYEMGDKENQRSPPLTTTSEIGSLHNFFHAWIYYEIRYLWAIITVFHNNKV